MDADKRRWFCKIASVTLLFAFSCTSTKADESGQINYYERFAKSRKLSLFRADRVFQWSFPLSREWEKESDSASRAPKWPALAQPEAKWPLLAR